MAGLRWFKLDAGYPSNPKISGLSHAAFRLHITLMAYATDHVTDGRIAAGVLHHCCNVAAIGTRSRDKPVGELIANGLLESAEPEGAGWVLHDWVEMNPQATRAAIDAERARSRERQRRHRESVTP